MLILLAVVSAHVAAGSVLLIGTRFAALIGLQQMAIAIGAASGIARVNRRLAESSGIVCGSPVAPQLSELKKN